MSPAEIEGSVGPGHPGARINWLGAKRNPASRGIPLTPPVTA